eukprot:TRINITY_DN31586_c0_g1_i3.p1 TRINITY_DN31586_c0_g1~~TRINITY_DN31586_c0_g1_i3.p1  ORF type:complete len:350 (-),score=100.92 TRINITY_DN31586_c0_g1_i3:63-1112(-)
MERGFEINSKADEVQQLREEYNNLMNNFAIQKEKYQEQIQPLFNQLKKTMNERDLCRKNRDELQEKRNQKTYGEGTFNNMRTNYQPSQLQQNFIPASQVQNQNTRVQNPYQQQQYQQQKQYQQHSQYQWKQSPMGNLAPNQRLQQQKQRFPRSSQMKYAQTQPQMGYQRSTYQQQQRQQMGPTQMNQNLSKSQPSMPMGSSMSPPRGVRPTHQQQTQHQQQPIESSTNGRLPLQGVSFQQSQQFQSIGMGSDMSPQRGAGLTPSMESRSNVHDKSSLLPQHQQPQSTGMGMRSNMSPQRGQAPMSNMQSSPTQRYSNSFSSTQQPYSSFARPTGRSWTTNVSNNKGRSK